MVRAFALLPVLVSVACAPEPLASRVAGLMTVNSVGIDEGAIALTNANDPCDRNGERWALDPTRRSRPNPIEVLFFFFSFSAPFDEGEHEVTSFHTPDEDVPDRPVFVTFRRGSPVETCDTDVFLDEWEGTLDISELDAFGDAAFSFSISSNGDATAGAFETTHRCEAVFELGNGCDSPEGE